MPSAVGQSGNAGCHSELESCACTKQVENYYPARLVLSYTSEVHWWPVVRGGGAQLVRSLDRAWQTLGLTDGISIHGHRSTHHQDPVFGLTVSSTLANHGSCCHSWLERADRGGSQFANHGDAQPSTTFFFSLRLSLRAAPMDASHVISRVYTAACNIPAS